MMIMMMMIMMMMMMMMVTMMMIMIMIMMMTINITATFCGNDNCKIANSKSVRSFFNQVILCLLITFCDTMYEGRHNLLN